MHLVPPYERRLYASIGIRTTLQIKCNELSLKLALRLHVLVVMYLSKLQRLEYQERCDVELMRKRKLRDLHHLLVAKADELLLVEAQLLELLGRADIDKVHSHFGFRSLRGYCTETLRLSRIQSQRLVTIARRKNNARDPNLQPNDSHTESQPIDSDAQSYSNSPDMSHLPIRKWMLR